MITLKVKEWNNIRKQLIEEYRCKPSVFMIREVMKRELGFTSRNYRDSYQSIELVFLDFYDDAKETWFRMKYL